MITHDLVGLVQDRYAIAYKNQKEKFEKFTDFDYIYNNKLRNYDPNIPSKVFNPILWSFIETIITRMLAKTPTVAYKPIEETDEANAQILNQLFTYWFNKCDIYPRIVQWCKQSLVYGTGIVKVDWYTSKPRVVKTYIFDADGTPMTDEAGNFLTQTYKVTDYDDPRLKVCNIYDVFVDPSAEDIDSAQWLVYQYWANIDDLAYENEQSGKEVYNKNKLKQIKNQRATNYNEYETRRREAVGFNLDKPVDTTVNSVLIWEMWEDDRLVVVADGMFVLRDTANPYWHGKKPFIRLVDSIVALEFWGKGEIEPVEKLLHALNTTQNQRITNINRILAPMWKARPGVDDEELNFTDNGIIHVNDLEDAEFIQMPDVTARAYEEAEVLKEDMQRALGVTDYVQGVQTPGQTAKEVEIKTAQANARFSHKVKLFEEMALRELGNFVYQLYQQYVTKERVIRIVGDKGEQYVKFTPQDIVGQYDVVPESESTLATDSEYEFEKFANLFSMVQPYVQTTAVDSLGMPQTTGFVSDQELVRELFKRSGEKDVDKYFTIQQGDMHGQVQGSPTGGREAPFLPALMGDVPVGGMAGVGGQDQVGL